MQVSLVIIVHLVACLFYMLSYLSAVDPLTFKQNDGTYYKVTTHASALIPCNV